MKSKNAAGAWVDDPVRIANFKQCFRHFSLSIESTNPQALVAWDAELGDDAWNDKVYPGDDVVDRILRDQYDGSWTPYTYPFRETGCDEACKDVRRKKRMAGQPLLHRRHLQAHDGTALGMLCPVSSLAMRATSRCSRTRMTRAVTTDTRLRGTSIFTTAYPRASAKYRELFGH